MGNRVISSGKNKTLHYITVFCCCFFLLNSVMICSQISLDISDTNSQHRADPAADKIKESKNVYLKLNRWMHIWRRSCKGTVKLIMFKLIIIYDKQSFNHTPSNRYLYNLNVETEKPWNNLRTLTLTDGRTENYLQNCWKMLIVKLT